MRPDTTSKNKDTVYPDSFKIGEVYKHPRHGLVYVEDGQFLGSSGGISNFWTFRKINLKGIISKKEINEYGGNMKKVKYKKIVKFIFN